jgi:hypothetical protein
MKGQNKQISGEETEISKIQRNNCRKEKETEESESQDVG